MKPQSSSPFFSKSPRQSLHRSLKLWLLPTTLILFCVVALSASGSFFSKMIPPASAAWQQSGDTGQGISASAWQQIQELAAEKAARTPEQRKIDSQLLYAAKMDRGEKLSDSVATLQVKTETDNDKKTIVDITIQLGGQALENLEANGAEILDVVANYNHVRARVALDQLEQMAALPEVRFIQPQEEMRLLGAGRGSRFVESTGGPLFSASLAERAARGRASLSKAVPRFAANRSSVPLAAAPVTQGDVTHNAAAARSTFGMNGTGVKIGVLSNGVANLKISQSLGALGSVNVLSGAQGSGDEGTAMLEIIHALVPGAQLYFATAGGGSANFANNIRRLRAAGCDIIVDDVIYLAESPFQDGQTSLFPATGGVIAQAVNDVTAAGAMYFSSAGNQGNLTDNTASVWEGDFKDGGNATNPLAPSLGRVHAYPNGQLFNVITISGTPAFLFWSDPLGASTNDYDLYVVNSTGTGVIAASTGFQDGTQDPIEFVGSQPSGARIVIVKFAGAGRFLHLDTFGGGIGFVTTGQTHGHSAGAAAFSVAATPAGVPLGPAPNPIGPFPNPFNSSNTVERFSSDGPRRLFFKGDGTPFTPGNFSSTGGILRQKPDITAADGVSVTGVGGFPTTFFGTSAAAPHAAAIAALIKSANPSFTNDQIRTALISSAVDIESPGVDRNSGAGIVMAFEGAQFLGVLPMADIDLGTVTATEVGGNGNGLIETGEGGKLNIQLKNLGLLNATNITATLTSSTPGVLVTSNTSSYPDLTAKTGVATNSLPFNFVLSTVTPCSSTSIFTLTINYAGGPSAKVFNIEVPTGLPPIQIASTLDATAPIPGTTFTTTTGLQIGRITRDGLANSCGANKTFPGFTATTGARRFDAYTFPTCFTNAPACITVTLTSPCGSGTNVLFAAAYLDSFDPNDLSKNYLGDFGASAASNQTAYASFNVRGGRSLVIVVHEVNPGISNGCNYTLAVSGLCQTSCATANLVCLQDDRTGDNLLFNYLTGDYTYTRCGDNLVLNSRGQIRKVGCQLMLNDGQVSATINHCSSPVGFFEQGHAQIKIGGVINTIKDTKLNSTCSCR